jgi:hypothetical protein
LVSFILVYSGSLFSPFCALVFAHAKQTSFDEKIGEGLATGTENTFSQF